MDVDNELTKATVFLSVLDGDAQPTLDAMRDHRGQLKKAIGQQAHLRRVPDLEFSTDPAIETGGRVEDILAELRDAGEL